jgi:psiF repeat
MNKLVAAMAVPIFFAYLTVAQAATPQQQKMKDCNAEAGTKDLKGNDREAFMKSCLSAKAAKAPQAEKQGTPQQQKMKTCNKEAGDKQLKGDERKKFMSSCLSA